MKLLRFFSILLILAILGGSFSSRQAAAAPPDYEAYTYQLSQSTAAYQFWTAPPSERIFKDSAVPSENGADIKVYAAKNEFEPFQVVVKPAASGSLTVSMDAFGAGITAEIYQVKYVDIDQATDALGRTGPYPDPLWPLSNGASVAVTAGENTAFWISLSSPAAAPAGDYNANLHLGGVSLPVSLHVFNFAIPDELHVG